ncbi:MAG: SPFH domain-containing protein [Telmatospirillum sp.]|nr:SPFH domain-containing protein [Telmatospirillum sp.]
MVVVIFLVFMFIIFGSFFTVQTAEAAVISRFGKYLRVANAGLNWKVPFIDAIAGRMSLKVQAIDLEMETKTKDNVFVTIPISVQVGVRPDRVFEAYYKLSTPRQQIQSYVEQVILGHVPSMTLDDLFERRSEIATAVQRELKDDMAAFGYEIVSCQVTDIVPDPKVKAAMNEINAAERQKTAATAKGEAEKILIVKQAEAEAESKRLQGVGIANERAAIAKGLRASIETVQSAVGAVAPVSEVMRLVLITQYFDTLKAIGQKDGTNTLFLSHSPQSIADINDQITQALLLGTKGQPLSR